MLYAFTLEGINIPLLPLIRERRCKMLHALSLGRIKRDSGINFRPVQRQHADSISPSISLKTVVSSG